MTIDWLTVSAQIVNFLILVWLLKRFLYRPVLRAMDRRESGIRERLEQAAAREAEAEQSLHDYRRREAELAQQRQTLLDEARDEATRRRREWLDAARDEVNAQRTAWQQQLNEEREALLERFGQRALASLEATLRQALRDLADRELEARLIDAFIARLDALDASAGRRLAEGAGEIEVATSFAPAPEDEARLREAVKRRLGETAEVRLTRASSLICGVELMRDGYRLGWSLADYLETLHARVEGDLNAAATAGEAG
ncbi:hypothetical protein [Halomonas getboli]|uniref:F0F1 ATP synthase subunit B family protein n=1 Tax=Halomonas getboli TaxID=2935862 RepID=UPI001FFF012A|nr:hypothetical protein [Halomonas getboli]MCK2184160.1 hypothetical protein [Halomonas getboli]